MEEDREILVCRAEELKDAVTLPVLQANSKTDKMMQMLREDIIKGRLRKELEDGGYKKCLQCSGCSDHEGR